MRAIEGIPQGNLDRYTFDVDDPAWKLLTPDVPTDNRRGGGFVLLVAGVHSKRCMQHYGKKLVHLLDMLVERGGIAGSASTARSNGGRSTAGASAPSSVQCP